VKALQATKYTYLPGYKVTSPAATRPLGLDLKEMVRRLVNAVEAVGLKELGATEAGDVAEFREQLWIELANGRHMLLLVFATVDQILLRITEGLNLKSVACNFKRMMA